jgi:hypothetical protein
MGKEHKHYAAQEKVAMDFTRPWSTKTEISVGRFIHCLGVTTNKCYEPAASAVAEEMKMGIAKKAKPSLCHAGR